MLKLLSLIREEMWSMHTDSYGQLKGESNKKNTNASFSQLTN